AHVYYDPVSSRDRAARLRDHVAAAFPGVTLGRWHDTPANSYKPQFLQAPILTSPNSYKPQFLQAPILTSPNSYKPQFLQAPILTSPMREVLMPLLFESG